jgi:DNA-binding response OmpR family regulator
VSSNAAAPVVLVVDDCTVNRMIVEATLQTEGYRLLSAASGPAALAAIAREMPALVLLDMRMPGMDGDAVIQRVRREFGSDGPAIMLMTAMSEAEAAALAREIGADDFCSKPFEPSLLRERVRALLQRRHARAGPAR